MTRAYPLAPTVLACPFCGWHDVEIDEIEPGRYAVDCPECECIGPFADSIAAAIAAWNLAHLPNWLLLKRCQDFILGFEDDPLQEGIADLLADLRAATGGATAAAIDLWPAAARPERDGEALVLANLLQHATALLRTIDPDDTCESEQLEALIGRAEAAYTAVQARHLPADTVSAEKAAA